MSITVPTSFTDESLAASMHSWLGGDAGLPGLLGWAVADGSYNSAIMATLMYYGDVTDLSGATNIPRLMAYASIAAWDMAAAATAPITDWSRNAESIKSSQAHDHAVAMAKWARAAAAQAGYPIGPVPSLVVSDIVYRDPYARTTRKAL